MLYSSFGTHIMTPAYQRLLRFLPASYLLVFGLSAQTVQASTYLPISDSNLADSATVIVEGRVLAADPASTHRPAIDYRIEVEHLIKGSLGNDSLVVRVPGGVRTDGIGLLLRGVPRFHVGDEVLLFLDPKDGVFALHQLMLGAFGIHWQDGLRIAERDLSDSLRLKGSSEDAVIDDLRDADRFRHWLEQRAAGTATSKSDYFLPAETDDHVGTSHDETSAFRTIISPDDPPPFGCGENGGHSVRWFQFSTDPETARDVGWRTHFNGQEGVPGGGIGAFGRALAAWTDDPNTPIRYVYDGLTVADGGLSTNDGINAVLFDDPNNEISGTFDGEGLLALGGPWFDCETVTHQGQEFHPILGADIVTQDGLELFFASTPDPTNAAEQLFAHELGHTLGLAHSEDGGALMRGLFHPDTRGAALDIDDLAGAFYLYGEGSLTPPAAPAELAATEKGDGHVHLRWSDTSDNESVFRIERRQSGDFELVTNVAAGETSFTDTDTQPLTFYGYRLRAQNAAGPSDYSNVETIRTSEDRRPHAPSNLRAAPLSSSAIRLAWQDNSDDETSFLVEILIPPIWTEIPVALAPNTTEVIVEGLPPATSLSFRVRAVNDYGASAASNHATTSTFDDDTACVVTGDELCLLGGRFKISVDYQNQHDRGKEGTATVVPSTDETGMFWFFNPENIELIVKTLDGRHINQHFWLFYGALSDLEYTIRLTDTVTDRVETYYNPPGEICGLADLTAIFEQSDTQERASSGAETLELLSMDRLAGLRLRNVFEPPASRTLKSGSCQPGPLTLCLLDGRLSIEVWWRNPHDGMTTEGPGQAIVDSDTTGMFWFFNIENTELVVKALDGGALNQHLWLFYGALTDLEYWITVTDTVAGESRVYYNPPGQVCGQADIRAFDAEPLDDPPADPSGNPALPESSDRVVSNN